MENKYPQITYNYLYSYTDNRVKRKYEQLLTILRQEIVTLQHFPQKETPEFSAALKKDNLLL